MQNARLSGSKNERSIRVHASNVENSDTEDEDNYPPRAAEKHELRYPDQFPKLTI